MKFQDAYIAELEKIAAIDWALTAGLTGGLMATDAGIGYIQYRRARKKLIEKLKSATPKLRNNPELLQKVITPWEKKMRKRYMMPSSFGVVF